MTTTTLSAALIVKNEERFLAGCLQSLAGLVDEVVVVDTGSTDSTVEIARAHRARVFDFAWNGRFDGARNAGLERCTGEWILYVDADERTRPCDGQALRESLGQPELLACEVQFVVRRGYTPYREWRLFR